MADAPRVAVKFRPSDSASESIHTLIRQLKLVWPRVSVLSMFRLERGAEVHLGDMEIAHVEGMDNPGDDARAAVDVCEENANERGKSARYAVRAYGDPEPKARLAPPLTKRGKPKEEVGEEPEGLGIPLVSWSTKIAAGESEVDDKNPMATMAGFMKTLPSIFDGGINAASRALDMNTVQLARMMDENATLRAENSALRLEQSNKAEWSFKMRCMEIEAEVKERDSQRDEKKEDRQRDADARAQHEAGIRTQQMIQFGERALFRVFLIAKMRAGEVPTREESAEAEPPSIPRDLADLLTRISDEEKKKLEAALGDQIWDLIVNAAKKTNDDEASAVLLGIASKIKADPRLLLGINASADILDGQRIDELLRILKRAGVRFGN